MKKVVLFTLLIFSMLLSACSAGGTASTAQPTSIQPTQKLVEPTTPSALTTSSDMDALTANPWMWIGFTDPTQQYTVDTPQNYTLAFKVDGTVNIKADCNNATGTYQVDGQSLSIEVGPMTRAMCPPESRSEEFIKNLGAVAIYFFKDGNLFLDLKADGGTMEFSPITPAPKTAEGKGTSPALITVNPWQWVAFTNPVQQYQISDPQNYLLTFKEDGMVEIKADCNPASGTYTLDGKSLTITIGPTTLTVCSAGSHSDDYIKYLGFATSYFFEGDDLFIELYADGGTLQFSSEGK